MRVLHVYNLHRKGGGSDNAALTTISLLRTAGLEVDEFSRDSRSIAESLRGNLQAAIGGIYAREAIRAFSRTIASRRPDLIHVHELYPLIGPSILPLCSAADIPVVMSCYDFRLTCPVATHYSHGELCHRCIGGHELQCVRRNCRDRLTESAAFAARNAVARIRDLHRRHVAKFIVLTPFSRNWLIDRAGVAADRIAINPPAIRLPRTPVHAPDTGDYVGYAGRFVPEKGVEVMVDACRQAGLPMRFAGDADSHPAVGPDDRAEFVMTRSSDELAAFYRGARMLVVPSIWYETFGIVAAEAMSHGIPVVASAIGALQDTVSDGESGLLAAPGDAADLAQRLTQIWHDPDLCRRLGAGARARVTAEYTPDRHVERLREIYREVAA